MKKHLALVAGSCVLLCASTRVCSGIDDFSATLTGVVTNVQNTFQGPSFDTGVSLGAPISASFTALNGQQNVDGSITYSNVSLTFSLPAKNMFLLGPGFNFGDTNANPQGTFTILPGGNGTSGYILDAFGFPGSPHLDYDNFDLANNQISFPIFEVFSAGEFGPGSPNMSARVDVTGQLISMPVPDMGMTVWLLTLGLIAIEIARRQIGAPFLPYHLHCHGAPLF